MKILNETILISNTQDFHRADNESQKQQPEVFNKLCARGFFNKIDLELA